jgi:hypothetical protein
MSFKVENLGLEVICRDHLKEDDEGIKGFYERFNWFGQLCFGL